MDTERIPTEEEIRDFVIAAHGNLPRVREMLVENPALVNVTYRWGENDQETAIQAAAQTGSAPVVEYLLSRGAPLDICIAAMLGRREVVERMLKDDPGLIQARGAHGISLLSHAAMSGNVDLAKMLFERGATQGATLALANAISKGYTRMARWLLENAHPDFAWKNFDGKSLLTIAGESPHKKDMLALLREHGAA